jgi:predicted Zn-dependent protease
MQFPEGWQSQNQMQAVIAVGPDQNVLVQLTLSQATSPQEGARQFLSQEGVAAGTSRPVTINGLPAVNADFSAPTDQGALKGTVTFVDYNDQVYQLLAYGTLEGWLAEEASARNSIGSFQRLTDPTALAVQPMRLRIIELDRAMTIEEFAERFPGPVGIETLSLINRVDSGAQIPAGTLVKRIVGEKIE